MGHRPQFLLQVLVRVAATGGFRRSFAGDAASMPSDPRVGPGLPGNLGMRCPGLATAVTSLFLAPGVGADSGQRRFDELDDLFGHVLWRTNLEDPTACNWFHGDTRPRGLAGRFCPRVQDDSVGLVQKFLG